MIFRQITHDDLGCASYLVGDADAGVAAVVDPRLDIDEYLRLARYLGARIEHVLETHNHADHVSGHGRLAASTGATIHIHRTAAPDYDHEPFDDGWELALGALVVRALHTPGHRPEHTAFPLIDTERGASRGRCSQATPCSSAASRALTSRSTRARARTASSTRSTTAC
jgi:hydroxyacylglutathione hydrolase